VSETRTLCRWTEHPYTSYAKRSHEIQHRVVVERYDRETYDVRHEVRSSEAESVPSTWTEAKVLELRPHGMGVLDATEVMRS